MSAFVTVRDLHKVHRRSALLTSRQRPVHAVNGVSFEIERGTVFGLVGESGSGKSTLARALLYLDRPTSGQVLVDEIDLGALSRKQLVQMRRRMQIVSQDPTSALNPRLKIETSVGEGLANRGVHRRQRRDRVAEVLELVGIPASRMHHYPHEFSGGMKQRICIARALAVKPDLLVLDEPVSSLDVSIQAQIINLLTRLRTELNLTYLFISHDLNLVGYISDTIGVMRRGELVELASAEVLLDRPSHEYTQELLRSVPVYVDRRVSNHVLHKRSVL